MSKDNFSAPPNTVTTSQDSLQTKAKLDSSTALLKDSTKKKVDSVKVNDRDGIKTSVKYASEDSIIFDAEKQTMKLFGSSNIEYGDVNLKAEEIDINWLNNNVEARGKADSTGKLKGTPIFKEKSDEYQTKKIVYNFKTKRGIISEVITKQGDGYIHGERVKKNEDNELFVNHSKYTTCNLAKPHFHIASSKIKMIPDKKVISGPFHLAINDVPMPLGFLFGFFPIPKNRSSGLIVPSYGESQTQGFFLQQGGFYWAMNDYIGMRFLGDIYSLGGAGATQITEYRKKYAFEGGLNFRYKWVVVENAVDEKKNINQNALWINWRHSTLSKKLGRLTANVDAGTSNFNQINVQNTNPGVVLTPAFQSSVQYSQSFRNSPFSISSTLRQDQNTSGIKNFTLPDVNLAMNRQMPFQNIKGGKKTEAIRKLNFSYNMNLQNRITNDPNAVGQVYLGADSIKGADGKYIKYRDYNFTNDFDYLLDPKNFNNGMKHSIPVSTSIKVMKYFSLNPSMSYDEFWYTKSLTYSVDTLNKKQIVKKDTVQGFSRASQYAMGASLTTRIYGTFFIRKARIEAIRHTLVPNLNYSYRPDFAEDQFGYYQTLLVNGEKQRLSKFQGLIQGGPAGGKSSLLGFSLRNTFEMKVKEKNDSVDAKKKYKKIMLLDDLGLSGNYNLNADSFNLSNISASARTKLFGMFDVTYSAVIDPYDRKNVMDTKGLLVSKRVNQFQWDNKKGIVSIAASNLSFGFGLNSQKFKKTKKPEVEERSAGMKPMGMEEQILEDIKKNPNKYLDFTIPWSFNMAYNLTYQQLHVPNSAPDLYNHSITYNGDISFTEKWKIQYSSGFNLTQKNVTYTRIGITRDLHCWMMSVNWVPPIAGSINTGSYNFQINAKSSVLQDLKLTKNRFWTDQ